MEPVFLAASLRPQHVLPDPIATAPTHKGHLMRDQFSNAQQTRKPAVSSKGGRVAAQSHKAAEVGAEVLAASSNCVEELIVLANEYPYTQTITLAGRMIHVLHHLNELQLDPARCGIDVVTS